MVDGVPVLTADAAGQVKDHQHARQRIYYDREYGAYRSYRLEPWQRAYLERMKPLWQGADSGRPFLDVGAGGSAYTVIEAARAGIPAVACDLSVEGMRTAWRFAEAEGVLHRCLFIVASAERLPFVDAGFGSAASIAVLEHLPDDGAAISELARVTRPGGQVYVAVPNSLDRLPRPLRPLYRSHDRRVGHLRHYSAGELTARSQAAGLRPLRTVYSAHWIKVWQLLLHLIAQRLRIDDGRLWWWMEGRDARAADRDTGMHLSLFLEREDQVTTGRRQ